MATIEELMKIDKNEIRIREVSGNSKNIIPFIGAGISASCGLLGWKKLLDELASDKLSEDEKEKYKAEDIDLIQYAEDIVSTRDNELIIQKEVAALCEFDEKKISNLPKLIVDGFSGQIFTTNYDVILEHVSNNQIQSILPNSQTQIEEAIKTNRKFIYHLHGSTDCYETIVLSKRSYQKLYESDKEQKWFYDHLCSLYISRMFLFIGCSLKNDYSLEVLKSSIKKVNSSFHYAIVERPDDEEERLKYNKSLEDLGILPIYYPKGEHECVELLLNYIIKKPNASTKRYNLATSNVNKGKRVGNKVKKVLENEIYSVSRKYMDPMVSNAKDKDLDMQCVENAVAVLLKENVKSVGTDEDELKSVSFGEVIDRILNCSNQFVLSIKGLQGTGKSTFLSLLFEKLYQIKETTKLYPILIDLHFWAKDENSRNNINSFKNDLNQINNFVNNKKYSKYILLIDGIDDCISNTTELDEIINDFIKVVDNGLFAFCFSLTEKIPDSLKKDEKLIKPLQERAEYTVELHRLKIEDDSEIRMIINCLSVLYGLNDNERDELTDIILKNTTYKIDFRTIILIFQEYYKNRKDSLSLGECFYNHYYDKQKGKKNFLLVAKEIYEYGIEKKVEKNKFINHLEIFYKNAITRDFFLAVFFINLFIDDEFSKIRKEYLKNEVVYTAQVNSFIKDLMETIYADKRESFITSLIRNWDECGVFMQSQIGYVLGRIGKNNVDQKAFLLEKWNSLKKELFPNDDFITNSDNYDKLFLFRTISVSLIKFDDAVDAQRFFLSCVLKNECLSDINRGFHLAYYGDKAFINGMDFPYKDLRDSEIGKTMSHLYENIRGMIDESIEKYRFFYLDIITLFSLYQYRNENSYVRSEYKDKLSELLDDLLNYKLIEYNKDLREYLLMLKHSFEKYGESAFQSIIKELYGIKKQKRTGWVERGIINPESVSDHMYSAFLLALLVLPESVVDCVDYDIPDVYKYNNYSKKKIKEMLLVHDLAESITGDIVTPQKTVEDEENEKTVIKILSYLDTYPNIYGSGEIGYLFEEYNKGETLNARIANEIDKMDALVQACIYNEEQGNKINIKEWVDDIVENEKIKTSLGKEIFNRILQSFGIDELLKEQ